MQQGSTPIIESGFIPNSRETSGDFGVFVPLATSGATSLCYRWSHEDRTLCVKRLRPELVDDARYRQLFRKEYEVGSMLRCPHVVHYYDYHEEPIPEIVMEYVEGETLRERLLSHPDYFRDSMRLRRFLLQLLEGLGQLHVHQIVHLDLKPDNIMLTTVNNDVKIIDMGFCYSSLYRSSAGRNELFAAPEQMDGSVDLDARTDIYAFGCILEFILDQSHISPLGHGRQYHRIARRCMAKRKEDRYSCVADIQALLSQMRPHWLWPAMAIVVPILLLGLAFYLHLPRAMHRMATGYDFVSDRLGLRVLSDDSLTCEVVCYLPDGNVRNLYDASILSHVKHQGQVYRIVSIADSCMAHDSIIRRVSIDQGVSSIGCGAFRDCPCLSTLVLPSSCTELQEDAFAYCTALQHVVLPLGLRRIPRTCFHHTGLRAIDIPEGVTAIGQDAFVNCAHLTEVRLPSTLTTLDRGVFYMCSRLDSITLPAQLSHIGEYAFMECKRLVTVYNLSENPQRVTQLFDDPRRVTVYVPAASLERYRQAPYWRDCDVRPMTLN